MTQQQTAYVVDARSVRAASATLYLAIPLFVALAFGWNRTLVGPETSPPILLRLPETLQGDLVFLQAEDHYVRVTTTAGQTLVHSRFAAASPIEGVQIHRSFWVASQAVVGLKKTSGAYAALLTDGSLLPVSRTPLATIRRLRAITPAR